MEKSYYQNSEFIHMPTARSDDKIFNHSKSSKFIHIAVFVFTIFSITFLFELSNKKNMRLEKFSLTNGINIHYDFLYLLCG